LSRAEFNYQRRELIIFELIIKTTYQ